MAHLASQQYSPKKRNDFEIFIEKIEKLQNKGEHEKCIEKLVLRIRRYSKLDIKSGYIATILNMLCTNLYTLKLYEEALQIVEIWLKCVIPAKILKNSSFQELYQIIGKQKKSFGHEYEKARIKLFQILFLLKKEEEAITILKALPRKDWEIAFAFEIQKKVYDNLIEQKATFSNKTTILINNTAVTNNYIFNFLKKAKANNIAEELVKYQEGLFLFAKHKYKAAIKAFKISLDILPHFNNANLYYHLGKANYFLKNYHESIDILRKCINIDPSHILAMLQIGISFNILGCYIEAEDTLKEAHLLALELEGESIFISENRFNIEFELFFSLYIRGLEAEAMQYSCWNINYSNRGESNWLKIINLAISAGKYEIAIKVIDNLINLELYKVIPQNLSQLKYLCLYKLGKYDEAELVYISTNSFLTKSSYCLSLSFNGDTDFESSIKICQKIISQNRYDIRAKQILFQNLYLSGKEANIESDEIYEFFRILPKKYQVKALKDLSLYLIKSKNYYQIKCVLEYWLSLEPNSLLANFIMLWGVIFYPWSCSSSDRYTTISKNWVKLQKINYNSSYFYTIVCDFLSKIYSFDNTILKYETITHARKSFLDSKLENLLIVIKIKLLWETEQKKEAIKYLILHPKVFKEINISHVIPELGKYSVELLRTILHRVSQKNNEFGDINALMKEEIGFCINIINYFDLADKELVLNRCPALNKILTSNNYGPKFIPRKDKNGKYASVNNLINYDILYYVENGSKYIIDYKRSLIIKNSENSISSLPKEIYNMYLFMNETIKSNQPPIPLKILHKFEMHNNSYEDYYAWMKNRTQYHYIIDKTLIAENKYVDTFFQDQESNLKSLVQEMNNITTLKKHSSDVRKDYYYYSYWEEDKGLMVYCRIKTEVGAKEEVILDGNRLYELKPFMNLKGLYISKEFNYFAYGIDYEGDEDFEIKIKDLKTLEYKTDILKSVDQVKDSPLIIWHNNIEGFFYKNSTENIMFHRIGSKQENDFKIELVLEYKNFIEQMYLSDSGDYIIFSIMSNEANNEIYIISLNSTDFTPILIMYKRPFLSYTVEHNENYIYARINDLGNNFRIIRLKIDNISSLVKIVGEEYVELDKKRYLKSFCTTKHYLILNYLNEGKSEIKIIRFSDKKEQWVTFPEELCKAYAYTGDYNTDLIKISYSSFLKPEVVYQYDFENDLLNIRSEEEIIGLNKENYVIKQIWANNRGVKIPITLFYNKLFFKKDGSNPLYLTAYGSYNEETIYKYDSSFFSLVDRGIVCAIAHVRGSGDLGMDWWLSATKAFKNKTIEDFIKCSEKLIALKYTSSDQLIIDGSSAGGMLVCSAINSRPELFKAAIAKVPYVDFLNNRREVTANCNLHINEFGDIHDKDEFSNMASYCPYMNIKSQDYPAIYVTNGFNDSRVCYYEPLKWVSKFREFNTSSSPVFLKTNMQGGHFYSDDKFAKMRQIAYEYIFIFKILNLGFLETAINCNIKGKTFSEEKNYKQAIVEYDKAINLNPKNAVYYYNKGNALYDLERYKEAILEYSKAINLNSKDPDYFSNKGTALYDLERYKEAIVEYSKAIHLDPTKAMYYNNKGSSLYDLAKYKEAIVEFSKAISLNPKNAVYYYNKGSALLDLEKYKEAIKVFDKAIKLDSKNAVFYYKKGNALYDLEKYKEAIVEYSKAIYFDPQKAKYYNNIGTTLHSLERYKEAIVEYSKAINLNPTNSNYLSNKGNALCSLEKYKEAIKVFDKSIELDPINPVHYYNKGNALYNLKRYKEALIEYDKAINLNPKDPDYFSSKSNTLCEIGCYNEALEMNAKVIELQPNVSANYNNRAAYLNFLKQYQESIKAANKAIKLDPIFANPYKFKGDSYYYMGRYKAALKQYNKALKLNPNYIKATIKKCLTIYYLKQFNELADIVIKIMSFAIHKSRLGIHKNCLNLLPTRILARCLRVIYTFL